MTERIQAVVTHAYLTSADRVYDAWLDPAKVRAWMRSALQSFGLAGEIVRIDIDPRVGGKFFFSDMRNGIEARHWGTYLELERPRKVVFTWIVDPADEADPSRVSLTIEPEGSGCVATLAHAMDPKWIDYVERTKSGWSRMLAAINQLLNE